MHLNNGMQGRILDDFIFINDYFEILTIELIFGTSKAVVCGLCHSPTSSIEYNNAFIVSLTGFLGRLNELKAPLILVGDVNVSLLNPGNMIHVDTFINTMFELELSPVITARTKINAENHITRFSLTDHF